MNGEQKSIDLKTLQHFLGGTLIWAAAAFLLMAAVIASTIRIGQVSGEQVGLLLDRIRGTVTVIDQSGVKIYFSPLSEFHVIDKTLQSFEMTETLGQGERSGKDDLKIKTVDGSDVRVDLKVQYKIDPNMAADVIATSGKGDRYKEKWARDYIRSISRNYLGQLTTEEFYDAAMRDAKMVLAREDINGRLKPFGIIIDSIVIPRRARFYREYQDMIDKKKLADQAVLQEISKAQAARQKQQTLIVQETNKKNVAVKQYEGEMEEKLIAVDADAQKATKAADAYFEQTTVAARARFYAMGKDAEGILAKKKAEADGIMALKKAMAGEGGRNMVKLEYARRLKDVVITGKPFTIQSNIERFEHLKGAASTGRE